jgi:transglutaminase-like putative cysteine protease
LQRYLPGGGPGTRITGVAFGSNAPITGRWVTDATPAIQINVPAGDTHTYYWRAAAYDHFDNSGWSWTRDSVVDRAGATDILAETDEGNGLAPLLRKVQFGVTPLAYRGTTVFSPSSPSAVDQNTKITLIAGAYFGALDLASGASSYNVTAVVPQTADDEPDGLTENKLRAASTAYPAEITNLYLDVPPSSIGPDMRALIATVEGLSPSDNPYDIAQTAVAYLRSPTVFTYSTDVTDVNCGDRSIAECFAHFKRGYCQYYATTMTMLMRMAGIPARYVQGFLPGDRDGNGIETIRYSSSHAWVEVYFPGYGWQPFDPTGGGVGRLTALPAGPPVASAAPTPARSRFIEDDGRDPLQALPEGGDIVPQPSSGIITPGGTLIVVALLLFVLVGSGVLFAWRRNRSRVVQPDAVYNGIARLAGRLGFGPRPTETVYEYTGALAQVLPTVRPELQLVANAKVEVVYGRAELPADRLSALKDAQRRLRLGLLRLALRRRGR